MRKLFGLLVLVGLLGCDDGDATVDAITFDEVDAKACGQLVYKITENQAMILTLPVGSAAFTNEPTPAGTPRTIPVGAGISVTFRTYSGTITDPVLCSIPAPIAPIATSEWLATAGTVEITTTPVYETPDPLTGQIKIARYRHAVIFRNIKFAKPDGTDQSYSEYVFGNYFTNLTNILTLNFLPENVALCPATNTLYNAQNGGKEGLYIRNFDPGLITPEVGVKTRTINQETNRVIYRYFAGTLPSGENENYFCSPTTTLATPPGTAEEWIAVDGDGVNGIVEVTTTTFGSSGGRQHTIRLKGVTFRKGNSTFYFGNDILVGDLIVE